MTHAFNPSTWEAEHRWISEFEAILVYIVSSRTARDSQRNRVLENKNVGVGYLSVLLSIAFFEM